jgi:hypothetical protein
MAATASGQNGPDIQHLHATIARVWRFVGRRHQGLCLAQADDAQPSLSDLMLADEIVPYRLSTALRKSLVASSRADPIGVALDAKHGLDEIGVTKGAT